MPVGAATRRSRKKRRSRRSPLLVRFFQLIIKMIISPVLLLWDSFRREETPDKTWLYSFFLLMTLMMLLSGAGILLTEGPLMKTVRMMATSTASREILPGDVQPDIALINKDSLRNHLDPLLVYAIIKTESDFRAKAVSPAGARGLMQIMPEVWRQYSGSLCNGRHGPRENCPAADCIFTPAANIHVGTIYLKKLLQTYHNRADLALEAYNAGLSNVKPGTEPRYEETQGYIAKILAFWQNLRRDILDRKLHLLLKLQEGVKILLGITMFCWLSLFWWAGRKLFH